MFRFLVESEGKEVESKRKKMKGMGVGCELLIYFLGLRYFQGGGLRIFFFWGGVRNFWGGGCREFFFWGGG